jgi:hypothetical protein
MNPILSEAPITQQELNFVYDSWIKVYKDSPHAGCIPRHLVHTILRAFIVDLVNSGAYLRGIFDGDKLAAWVCEDEHKGKPVVHFCYIKEAYRDHPEMRERIAPPAGYYTYRTGWLARFLGNGFIHDPQIARYRSAGAKGKADVT